MNKKVKISKAETVNIRKDLDEKKVSLNVYSFEDEAGKQVEMSEKDFNYVRTSLTRFEKSMEILERYYKGN